MAADPNAGYSYRPGFSSIGVIFSGPAADGRHIYFCPRVPHTIFYYPLQCNVNSTYICSACSSSDGLVALYDKEAHTYYIGNPLIPGQESYRTPLERTPRAADPPENTNAVLVTDFSIPYRPAYHLMCAFKDEDRNDLYTFDTYSSLRGSWRSYTDIQLPWWGTIRPNTGVSCGGFVYWLTMRPCLVVCFDINNIKRQPAAWWPPPVGNNVLDLPETKLQLGRIQDKVGLVVVDASDQSVTLYFLKARSWLPCAKVNLLIVQSSITARFREDGRLICSSLPDPLRFQTLKFEVFFHVSGRLVLLEMNSNNAARIRSSTVFSGILPFNFSLLPGTSHVGTSLLPAIFPLMPDRGMRQADIDDRESVAGCSTPTSSENF